MSWLNLAKGLMAGMIGMVTPDVYKRQKYDIPVIPHIICSGATKEDIEYELLDRCV